MQESSTNLYKARAALGEGAEKEKIIFTALTLLCLNKIPVTCKIIHITEILTL